MTAHKETKAAQDNPSTARMAFIAPRPPGKAPAPIVWLARRPPGPQAAAPAVDPGIGWIRRHGSRLGAEEVEIAGAMPVHLDGGPHVPPTSGKIPEFALGLAAQSQSPGAARLKGHHAVKSDLSFLE